MVFNLTKNYDFFPELSDENTEFGTAEEMKLLGLTLKNYLSWISNTGSITKKAYKRL